MGKTLAQRYPGAALVTGASSGLGVSFARHAARDGMDVVLVARRRERLEVLAGELEEAFGVRVHVVVQDLRAADAAECVMEQLAEQSVAVSLLVNNAGFGTYGRFDTLEPESQERMVDLNCRAPVALTSAIVPGMRERKNGAVVFVASIVGYVPAPYFATYGATKAFNLMYGEALWAELGPLGIDVIAISPGYTKSEFEKAAGIDVEAPDWLKAKPEKVVATCFRNLGRRPSVVHGLVNKFIPLGLRATPRIIPPFLMRHIGKPRWKREDG
jgi:short-subunit dehydrogenase